MTIHYRHIGDRIVIIGKTFPYKDAIKALGARFNGQDKTWFLPFTPAGLSAVDQLCRQHGGGGIEVPTDLIAERPATPATNAVPEIEFEGSPHGPNSEEQGVTVASLLQQAQLAIAAAFPQPVWLVGELDSVQQRATGWFLTIAESKDQKQHQGGTLTVSATLWEQVARGIQQQRGAQVLTDVLQEGMRVRVLVRVTLYRDRAQLSLNVLDIDPSFTKGALALAREKLLRELRALGLDRQNKALAMPAFPLRVGLISADGSRAKNDFLDQLFQGGYPGEVVFRSTPMQGDSTPEAVAFAIQEVAAAECDLIVITRGGGSVADLRWFDAREIALAIAHAPVPVIAAIGHHDDVCVAEEICYLRQKTPTAAAEFILEVLANTGMRLQELAAAGARRLTEAWNDSSGELQTLVERWQRVLVTLQHLQDQKQRQLILDLTHSVHVAERRASQRIEQQSQRLWTESVQWLQRLEQAQLRTAQAQYLAADRMLSRCEQKLASVEKCIVQKDPQPWLLAGWTQLMAGVRRVRTLTEVETGERIVARLRDGTLQLQVIDKVFTAAPANRNEPNEEAEAL